MTSLSNRQLRVSIATALVVVTLFTMVTGLLIENTSHARQKRHVLQMCELISLHTNRGCFDYNNYGCFCGLGNADSRHVDDVDKCCRAHDHCYGKLSCFWFYPQFVAYAYECNRGVCVCTDSQLLSSCPYETCQCDLKLASCLGKSKYNYQFSNYDRQKCNRKESDGNSTQIIRKKRRLKKDKNVNKRSILSNITK